MKCRRIAHVVNLFSCPPQSEMWSVQKHTVDSMRHARRSTGPGVEVSLLCAHYPEDRHILPDDFISLPPLTGSIQDVVSCADKRRLPFINEILLGAARATTAEYLVYSNADICLYPSFYTFLGSCIDKGQHAVVINRRQLNRWSNGKDLLTLGSLPELLASDDLVPHIGIDCVMIRRELVHEFPDAKVCIGYPPVGQFLFDWAEYLTGSVSWYTDERQTFHVGIDDPETSAWKRLAGNEIWNWNRDQHLCRRPFAANPWIRHGVPGERPPTSFLHSVLRIVRGRA